MKIKKKVVFHLGVWLFVVVSISFFLGIIIMAEHNASDEYYVNNNYIGKINQIDIIIENHPELLDLYEQYEQYDQYDQYNEDHY